ncbi:MAG TPA: lysophospholipid acyltransferase family protein [Prolixibacteraceae bacterium]|nr:lysophospholipid acyltransferase family protein [Prolixibacteraceae bacterium]
MIIKAKHDFFIGPFIRWYVFRKMKREFHSFHFNGGLNDRKKPVLLVCNHISWWDGIWALHYNQKFLHRKFHFMMLEEQLRKNWFLRYTGGFSVRKKSRSVVETIDYSAELLTNAKNMVLLFPSGKIQSMYRNNIQFEKGVEKIIWKAKNEIQVVFMVNLIDYFSAPKPKLFCFTTEFSGAATTQKIEEAYNLFYQDCLSRQSIKEE